MAGQSKSEGIHVDLASALGADAGVSTQCFTLYLPNKDKNGRPVRNHSKWVREARMILTNINGGASAYPPAKGTWRNDQGKTIWEETTIIYSFVLPETFLGSIPIIREFVHRFGRETNQGEVVCEMDQRFFRIRRYDSA